MKKVLFLLFILSCYLGYSKDFKWSNSKTKSVDNFISTENLTYNKNTNQYNKGNTVYLFIDENGNHIKTGYPTKLNKNNLYIMTLVVSKKSLKTYVFTCNFEGEYGDDLTIENDSVYGMANINKKEKYTTIPFATYGQFTDSFSIYVVKTNKQTKEEKSIYSKTLTISKTYHVSIAAGFFVSNLSNPLNVKAGITNAGEATLIADEVDTRGIVSVNAIYYPYGRNYLFPKEKFYQNVGILVGTQVNKDQFDNLFGGLQYDFSRGGSIAFGVHYGKVNTLSGLEDFTFGETLFDGDLNTVLKKEWKTGFFVGINLDIRIFKKLFNL